MTEALSVQLTNLAAQHIRQAEIWWREHRLNAQNAVREDLEKAFAIISTQPRIGAERGTSSFGMCDESISRGLGTIFTTENSSRRLLLKS